MPSIENIRTIKAHDPFILQDEPQEVNDAVHPLDKPNAQEKLRKLEDWWYQARQAQFQSRYEMALDQDFYDGLQWREDDKIVLHERGQLPLVFNRIKPSVDWVLGAEKRTKVDFKVFPRTEDDVELADVKTQLLKYVGDVNKASFHRSLAFADSVRVGVGWLEDGIRGDEDDEPLFSRYEDWKNIWYDHLSVERDLSDARYLFRSKWVDVDVAVAMFPERASLIEAAATSNNLYWTDYDELGFNTSITEDGRPVSSQSLPDDAFNVDNRRNRVRLIECWYRIPQKVQILRGFAPLHGDLFNPKDQFHSGIVDMGYASVYDSIRMQVWCAVFVSGSNQTTGSLLQDIQSPYRHNRFPFTPIWCYRRGRDRTAYGIIRNLRDPQEDLNKRRSKALFILSTNKMLADNDAFEDWDEAADELSRPDGILRKKKGADVQLINETALVEEHIMLERDDAQYIQDVSGVTDELMGRQTNAVSGIAIQNRQNQGSVVTAEIFDNLRFSVQIQGEIQLSLVEQFYDQQKVLRLIGNRGQVEFLKINQQDQATRGIFNDITASQADFVVDSQDFRDSVRQALFESMMELMGKLSPEISINILDLVIDMSDLPGKEEIVQRIRRLNGQVDPARQNDPQAQQEALSRAQDTQQQQQFQQQITMQGLAEQQARTRKLFADAALTEEKAKKERQGLLMEAIKAENEGRKVDLEHLRAEMDAQDQQHQQNMARFQVLHDAEMERRKLAMESQDRQRQEP